MANNDYSGDVLTMESFTAQTTDGSGDIVVTLQNTPVADDAIIVDLQGATGAFAQFKSRTSTSVTFTVFQKYDRIDNAAGSVNNLPTSVTTDTTTGGPTFTSSTVTGTQERGAETGSGANTKTHSHTTQISKISNHSHTSTGTALTALTSTGSITLVVSYAFN